MLQLEFPAFTPKLGNRDTRCIIDNQVGFSDHSGSLNELRPVLIGKVSGSEGLGIDLGFQREQTVYELFL